jgi:hypothetical protein
LFPDFNQNWYRLTNVNKLPNIKFHKNPFSSAQGITSGQIGGVIDKYGEGNFSSTRQKISRGMYLWRVVGDSPHIHWPTAPKATPQPPVALVAQSKHKQFHHYTTDGAN